jgi:hypothetical protein
MLKIWTAADTPLIKKTISAALQNFRPNVPAHKFLPFHQLDDLPEVGAGEILLACGNKTLDIVRKTGLIHKGMSLTKLRETPVKIGAGHLMMTYDPALTANEPDKMALIEWDLRLANRFLTTQSLEPVVGNYQWVNSFQPTIDWIEQRFAITKKPVDVAMDLETMGSPVLPGQGHRLDFLHGQAAHLAFALYRPASGTCGARPIHQPL